MSESADWLTEALAKVERMRSLPEGWDSYDAEPPNETACRMAAEALHTLHGMGFPPHRVAPTVMSGVALAWRVGKVNADIEFFNDGETCAVLSRPDRGRPEVWEVLPGELESGLRRIRDFIRAAS